MKQPLPYSIWSVRLPVLVIIAIIILTGTKLICAQEIPALWKKETVVPMIEKMKPDFHLIVDPSQRETESKIEKRNDTSQPLSNGNETNCREINCRSLESALTQFKNIRNEYPDAQIFVSIANSLFENQITAPILFDQTISGTPEKPTVIRGLKTKTQSNSDQTDLSESVILSGSMSLSKADWEQKKSAQEKTSWIPWKEAQQAEQFQERMTDELKKRIQPEIADSVWICDLKPLGIQNYGEATTLGKRPELFWNGIRQPLARFPNLISTLDHDDSKEENQFDESKNMQKTEENDTESAFLRTGKALGETRIETGWAGGGTEEGIFEFVGDLFRLKSWSNEPDLRLHGYFFWDWDEDYGKIESIDFDNSVITMQKPFHHYGYHDRFRYNVENALCELDVANNREGEWYLDRATEILFWFPPTQVDLSTFDHVRFSSFDMPYMIEIQNAKNLILTDFVLEQSRGSGIRLENCDNTILHQLTIRNMGETGLEIRDGQHNGVSKCFLTDLGVGGMKIAGGDRRTLTPGNHFVQDCEVVGFSRLKPTYAPAVFLAGCGHRVANNLFADSGSSALRLEGNDFLFEYNIIREVVNESDDQGGIDIWYNPSYRGITIRYNYWKNITGGTICGVAAIRFDDMISDLTIFGNVFDNCGSNQFGAIHIHGGKDNQIENNVMFDCFSAVGFTTWGEKRYLEALDGEFVKKKLYQDVNIDSPVFRVKYPKLTTIRQNVDVNMITRNLVVNCKNFLRNDRELQILSANEIMTLDDATATDNPATIIEQLCTPEFLKQHGLQPIPWQNIGPR